MFLAFIRWIVRQLLPTRPIPVPIVVIARRER
jgi:hypothetical protein